MLAAEQVLPFIYHDHPTVRSRALHYFIDSDQPSPLSAEHMWRGLEQFGFGQEGRTFLTYLGDLPQTDASIDRILRTLDHDPDEDVRFHLLLALRDVDPDALLRHSDRILACPQLTDYLRDRLHRRLHLLHLPLDDLWNRLLEESQRRHGQYFDKFNDGTFDALAQAIARYGDPGAARALEYVTVPPREDWAEAFCLKIIELARHRPALDKLLLLPAAAPDGDDFLHQGCQRAIPAVAGPDAVPPLAALLRDQTWGARIDAAAALARIRHPDAERELLNALRDPIQQDIQGMLLIGLTRLCPTGEAFDVLYNLARNGDYDRRDTDLKEDVFAAAVMSGRNIPEFNNWRRHADNNERRAREFFEYARTSPLVVNGMRGRALHGPPADEAHKANDPDRADNRAATDHNDDWDTPDPAADLPDQVNRYAPPVTATIRREEPKIGRNDPCPCGSGKKYKKCCG
jgi:hypothetical protein